MNLPEYCARVREELGDVPVGMSLTAQACDVLDQLGPQWMASVVRVLPVLGEDCAWRVELYIADREPMINQADLPAPIGPRVGVMTIGRGRPAPKIYRLTLPSSAVMEGASSFGFGGPNVGKRAVLANVYTRLYENVPLALDSYRQWRGGLPTSIPGPGAYATAADPTHTLGRTMWIAMHWAEAGGAESWAWEQARIAHDAGFHLVITFDRAAPQRQLDRAFALTDDVYCVGNLLDAADRAVFAHLLIERHDITDVHIHHSEMAYGALPFIRLQHPNIHVEDSTHIIEYRGGGFVRPSVELSDFIDAHHVISPQLVDFYRANGVDESKIIFRPLTNFTVTHHADAGAMRVPADHLRVGFLGRMSPQKRPYLFVRLARLLASTGGAGMEFIMQGTGELHDVTVRDVRRFGMDQRIDMRGWAPSDALLRDIDVLVVSSENEGLTLTTLEADAAGVLVVSCDVGSQRTVIAEDALLPRQPLPFLRDARRLLTRLQDDPAYREALLEQQHQKVQQLQAMESATDYFTHHYQEASVR